MPAKAGVAPIASAKAEATVVDNLPADIPITARELEVLETYLADLIDQLLYDASADQSGSAPK